MVLFFDRCLGQTGGNATGEQFSPEGAEVITSTKLALLYGRRVHAGRPKREPDLAEELEARDELLIACREVLLGVGSREAAALVAHIDALLDLDDEVSPGSQR